MTLADRVQQSRAPFVVRDNHTGRVWTLDNTADHAEAVATCPVRYLLQDGLTQLCADLAYSKGAKKLACADLLRMPSTQFWVEWCNGPWQRALQRYGFPLVPGACQWIGRRGALVSASADGRRGSIRTFWSVGDNEQEVLTSSIESFFDLDTADGQRPRAPDLQEWGETMQVHDKTAGADDDVLSRCFRFRYERSWAEYYANAGLSQADSAILWGHTLGTIALDIPMLLAFALLLCTRTGLPQHTSNLERLNRARTRAGRTPLLEHVVVSAPFLPEYSEKQQPDVRGSRRSPRLHHVRGHLMRRGSELFWRVPHLRGSARTGIVRSRTVIWTLDEAQARRGGLAEPHRPLADIVVDRAQAMSRDMH